MHSIRLRQPPQYPCVTELELGNGGHVSSLHTDKWAADAPCRSAGKDCDVTRSVERRRSWRRQSRDNVNARAIENVADWANWRAWRDAPQCSPANVDGDSASSLPTSDGDDIVSQNCSPRAEVACWVPQGAGEVRSAGSCWCSRRH